MKRSKTRSKMEKRISLEWFSACGGPEVPALWAEKPAFGRKFRPSGKSAKSFLGFLTRGVPELLPGSSPRKFSVTRKFRPWKFSGGILAKSFWVFLSGGVPGGYGRKFSPEISGPPEVPVHNTGSSGPSLLQRSDFGGGYKIGRASCRERVYVLV